MGRLFLWLAAGGKSNVKAAQSKSGVGKKRVGPRLPPGPALGWKCEAFQGFCVFCGCPSFLYFSQKKVGFFGLHFPALS
ncbi:TPA: hypothetical protein ACOEO9_001093 [Stenotrophomonas maltophilia]